MQAVPNPLREGIDVEHLLNGPNRLDHLLALLKRAHPLADLPAPRRLSTRHNTATARETSRSSPQRKSIVRRPVRRLQTRREAALKRSKTASPTR
jgi:hypothetical protein